MATFFKKGTFYEIMGDSCGHGISRRSIVKVANDLKDNYFYPEGYNVLVNEDDVRKVGESKVATYYKKGDKVVIVANDSGHGYRIGKILTIAQDNKGSDVFVDEVSTWFKNSDVKPFKQGEEMKEITIKEVILNHYTNTSDAVLVSEFMSNQISNDFNGTLALKNSGEDYLKEAKRLDVLKKAEAIKIKAAASKL